MYLNRKYNLNQVLGIFCGFSLEDISVLAGASVPLAG